MRSYRLAARMLLSLSALVALTAAFVGGFVFVSWKVGGIVAPVLFAPVSWGQYAGATLAGLLCVGVLVTQLRRGVVAIPDFLDAVPPSEAARSGRNLTDLVQRVALQFDVPLPTVKVAETSVPHASVSGLTRQSAMLVLSTGLLDRLSDEELRAVVAHEMAHVSNRDAVVVSLVALPAVFGRSVLNGLNGDDDEPSLPRDVDNVVVIFAFLLGGLLWLVGRSLLAVFARQRELAADSAAVELTGSAAALATALRKADIGTVDAPVADLRKMDVVAAFSVVEPPTESEREFSIWNDGRAPPLLHLRNRFVSVVNRLFRTHPSTERRCERLRSGR